MAQGWGGARISAAAWCMPDSVAGCALQTGQQGGRMCCCCCSQRSQLQIMLPIGSALAARPNAALLSPCRCPEECKNYWAGLPDACDALMSAILGSAAGDQMKDDKGNPISMR